MQLIKAVEIAYFRSIYKQRIDECPQLTVIFGRNDAGKSNFLRALNLFFNNETNPGTDFNFNRDLCGARRQLGIQDQKEVRKFIYVKLIFNTPTGWTNSLGKTFWVKKQWSVTRGTEPLIESSVRTSNRVYLTRFLNKVRFHYVPAIKDRSIFENLLEDVYQVLAKHDEFRQSLDGFADQIRERTSALSNRLQKDLGLSSVIAPPTDLTNLFRSLDFETSGDTGDNAYSLTLQRGDGVQVRHIPSILEFISDHSGEEFHVWGFEEPENSLELGNAIEEAKTLRRIASSKNKQIFVTSHSPAFYNLTGDTVRRYFVSKRPTPRIAGWHTSYLDVLTDEDAMTLMADAPHLALVAPLVRDLEDRVKQLADENSALEEARASLFSELSSAVGDILFVEGESDAIYVEAAWAEYVGGELPFEIVDGTGTTRMKALAAEGDVLRTVAPGRRLFVLIDNDKDGRELVKKGFPKRLKSGGVWELGENGSTWCLLKPPAAFVAAMKVLKVAEPEWFCSIENLFSSGLRVEAEEAGMYGTTRLPHEAIRKADQKNRYLAYRDLLDIKSDLVIYAEGTGKDFKVPFAKWVAAHADRHVHLQPLREIVLSLAQLLGSSTSDETATRSEY